MMNDQEYIQQLCVLSCPFLFVCFSLLALSSCAQAGTRRQNDVVTVLFSRFDVV